MRLFMRRAQKLATLKGEYAMKLLRALRAKVTGPTPQPAPEASPVTGTASSAPTEVSPQTE